MVEKKRRLGAAFFTNNTFHVPTIKNHLTDKKKFEKNFYCN